MTILTRAPGPALAPFVDVLWYYEEPLPPGRERTLPTGAMQLIVNLREDELRWYDGADLSVKHTTRGAGLGGTITRPVALDTAEQAATIGVCFKPGGTVPFFSEPADALVEPAIGLDVLWGRNGAVLRDRLLSQPSPTARLATLEQVLLQQVVQPLRPDPSTVAAISALELGWPVRGIVDRLGTTTSTFTRRFRTAVGLAPKSFGRVRRLQRVLGTVSSSDVAPNWAAVAYAHGFCDQSHLIHDFRALTGLTPSDYRPRSRDEHNHVPL